MGGWMMFVGGGFCLGPFLRAHVAEHTCTKYPRNPKTGNFSELFKSIEEYEKKIFTSPSAANI